MPSYVPYLIAAWMAFHAVGIVYLFVPEVRRWLRERRSPGRCACQSSVSSKASL
jgi:hypothetical protein